jgi:hypothetical protein
MGDRPSRLPHLETGDEEQPASSARRNVSAIAGSIVSVTDVFIGAPSVSLVAGGAAGEGQRRVAGPVGAITIDRDGCRIAATIERVWLGYGPVHAAAGLTLRVELLIREQDEPASKPAPPAERSGRLRRLADTFAATVERGRGVLSAVASRTLVPVGKPAVPVTRPANGWSIGWFADAGIASAAHAFVLSPDAGSRPTVGAGYAGRLRAVSSPTIEAVPCGYVISLRRRGAAYYLPAAQVASAPSPTVRPVAIDTNATRPRFAAVCHEGGGSSVASLRAVVIQHVPAWAAWFGSAHFADRLVGAGDLHHSMAEIGGIWQVAEGRLRRARSGVYGSAISNRAMASLREPSGLLHVEVDSDQRQGRVVLFFRHLDDQNCWRLVVRRRTARLSLLLSGRLSDVFTSRLTAGWPDAERWTLEVVDDGRDIVVCIDGRPVSRPVRDERLADASGLGFATLGAVRHIHLRNIEAHPRSLPLPSELLPPESLS